MSKNYYGIHLFIHSLNETLLSTYYVVEIFLSTHDVSVNKTEIPTLVEAYITGREFRQNTLETYLTITLCSML